MTSLVKSGQKEGVKMQNERVTYLEGAEASH